MPVLAAALSISWALHAYGFRSVTVNVLEGDECEQELRAVKRALAQWCQQHPRQSPVDTREKCEAAAEQSLSQGCAAG